jgi:hypothetical protein
MKAAALVIALALVAAARQPESTGVITGAVTLTVSRSAPLAASPYGRRGVPPKRSTNAPEMRNVVVYLNGLRPSSPPPPMRAKIAQRDEQFVPQVTAVTAGSTVDFPNEDPFFHNVFSLSKVSTFDLGRYPSGSSRARTFPKPGIVKVFCDIHSHMTALILVLDHPWFTIPGDDGTFTLPSVPAGEITAVAWHERIGERREKIRVTPGQTTRISFTLPVLEPEP